MGTVIDRAIIVSGNAERIAAAHAVAVSLLESAVSAIHGHEVNGLSSFVVFSSGSKVGWAPEKAHSDGCDCLVSWMRGEAYEDGSNSYDWVDVEYGETPVRVRSHSQVGE